MLTFIARRIMYSIPVLLIASFVTFVGIRWAFDPLARYKAPGGIADAAVRRRALQARRHALHLDENIVHQWWRWLTKFARGDWGISESTNRSVFAMVRHAMWPTLQLMFWGTILSLAIAVAIGIYSAVKQYSIGDYTFTGLSYIGIAMPPFWFALLAIGLLATWPVMQFHLHHPIVYFVGLHSTGQHGFNLDYLQHLVLPVATLTVGSVASWSRFQRASMLDVMHADYVRTARAKGVPRRKVILKHAFRNACVPLVTVVALDTAFLIGGLIITEQIFSIPGMGRMFFDALQSGDAPVLLGWFVVCAIAVVVMNLVADILYGVLDPRVRVA